MDFSILNELRIGLHRSVIGLATLALFLTFTAIHPAAASDRSEDLKALLWLEEQLISEKNELLRQIEDGSLMFLEMPNGSIEDSDRAVWMHVIDNIAFFAANEDLVGDFIKDKIEYLQTAGLWNTEITAEGIKEILERESNAARAEMARRVVVEYVPRIAEVQDYAQELQTASSEPTSFGAYSYTVVCPERNYSGSLEIIWISASRSRVQINLDGAYAGMGTLSGNALAFEQEEWGHHWNGVIVGGNIQGSQIDRTSSNNVPCSSWSATEN